MRLSVPPCVPLYVIFFSVSQSVFVWSIVSQYISVYLNVYSCVSVCLSVFHCVLSLIVSYCAQCVSVYQNSSFVLHRQPIALDKRTKNTLALCYNVADHLQLNLHSTTMIYSVYFVLLLFDTVACRSIR